MFLLRPVYNLVGAISALSAQLKSNCVLPIFWSKERRRWQLFAAISPANGPLLAQVSHLDLCSFRVSLSHKYGAFVAILGSPNLQRLVRVVWFRPCYPIGFISLVPEFCFAFVDPGRQSIFCSILKCFVSIRTDGAYSGLSCCPIATEPVIGNYLLLCIFCTNQDWNFGTTIFSTTKKSQKSSNPCPHIAGNFLLLLDCQNITDENEQKAQVRIDSI